MRNISMRRVIATSILSILPILASFFIVVTYPIPHAFHGMILMFAGLMRGLILVYLLDQN